MTEFLIGADPELFVRDRKGELVSAHGMIPGTKANPHQVEGGAVQVDGMALEFNINPASTYQEWEANITGVMAQLKEMIPTGYTFDFSPVAEFGADFIKTQPEEARDLGCDPDFNPYNSNQPFPRPDASTSFRTASGHVHIGWTKDQSIDDPDHWEACSMMARQLDLALLPHSFIWDRDTKRSSLYGKPGAFRPKSYGVEYRSLSNVWVDNADTRYIVYHRTLNAAQMLLSGRRMYDYDSHRDPVIYHKKGDLKSVKMWSDHLHAAFDRYDPDGIIRAKMATIYNQNKTPVKSSIVKPKTKTNDAEFNPALQWNLAVREARERIRERAAIGVPVAAGIGRGPRRRGAGQMAVPAAILDDDFL